MSRNVEENVVKMTFDNSEFDSNIEHSQKTVSGMEGSLNNLKNTVLQLPAAMVNGLSNVLQKIDLRDILGVAGLVAGINLVKNGITDIGMTVSSVASNAVMTVQNAMNSIIGQIQSGGRARAENIQQAKFMIEGLNMDVETFMEASKYAVNDTAFGLDAAAKAAAQLGASGVTSLEKLKYSLRGISGVAAMTNSSYEEIAHIFTTVAGMGKVTNQYLDSIAIKGLNARQKLGEQLGKTEEEVRDMAAKGQISFDMFAKAMDNAFGEHAKEANKTFSGVTSNINAALSKIGEGFQTPLITNTLGYLDKLRAGLNDFKSALESNQVYSAFSEMITNISGNLETMIVLITDVIKNSKVMESVSYFLGDVFKTISDIFGAFSFKYSFNLTEITNGLVVVIDKIKQIFWAAREAFDEVFGITHMGAEFHSIIDLIGKVMQSFDVIDDRDVKDVFKSWLIALKEIANVVADILGINSDNIENLFSGLVSKVFEFFKKLKLSDDEIDRLKRTASGLASAVDIIKMFVVQIFEFLKPSLGIVRPIFDTVLKGTAAIGDWVTNLRNSIKQGMVFEQIFEKLGKGIEFIKGLLSGIKGSFFDIFFGDGSKDVSFFSKISAFISQMFATIAEAFNKIDVDKMDFSPLSNLFSALAGFGNGNGGGNGTTFIDKIITLFNAVKKVIKSIASGISELFSSDDTKEVEEMSTSSESKSAFGKIKDGISFVISEIIRFTKGIVDAISGIDPKVLIAGGIIIVVLINAIKDVIIALIGPLNAIIKVAGIVAGLIILAIPAITAVAGVTGMMRDITSMFNVFKYFSKLMDTVKGYFTASTAKTKAQNRTHLDEVIRSMADFLYAITISLTILSLVPKEDLQKAIISVGALMVLVGALTVILAIVAASFERLTPKTKNLNKVAADLKFKDLFKGKFLQNGSLNKMNTYSESPLTGMAMLIQALTIGLIEIAASLKIVASISKDKNIWMYMGQLAIMLTLVAGIAVGLTMFVTKVKDIKASDMLVVAGAFSIISFALIGIAKALGEMSEAIPAYKIKDAWGLVGMLSVMVAVVAGVLVGMTAISKDDHGVSTLAAAASITIIILAIGAIVNSMKWLLTIASNVKDIEGVTKLLIVIAGAIGAILLVAGVLSVVAGAVGSSGPMPALAMAAFALDIAACAIPLIALVPLIAPALHAIEETSKFLANLTELYLMASEMDDADADKIARRVKLMISAIPNGIAEGIADSKLADEIKKAIPSLLDLLSKTIIPALDEIGDTLAPQIGEKALKIIKTVNSFLVQASPTVISDLITKVDPIIANAVAALLVMFGSILDAVNENIPMLTEKLFTIVMNIIETINRLLDENKEEILKNVTAICNFIISVATLSILSDQNLKAIYYTGAVVLSILEQGIMSRLKSLLETMAEMADLAVKTFLAEIATAGLYDSSAIWQEFWDNHVGDVTIGVDFDLSGAQAARSELEDAFNGMNYDYSGVYASNETNYRRQYQANVNRSDLKDSFESWAGSIKDTIAQNAKTQIDLKFTSDTYGQLQLLNQEDNIMSGAGWN